MPDVFVDASDDAAADDSTTIEMTETHEHVPVLNHGTRGGGDRGLREGAHGSAAPTSSPSHLPSSVHVDGMPTSTALGSLGRVESNRFGDVAPEEEFTDPEREKIDDDLLGEMGLADFMLLAYTISNIYQRHRARNRRVKLDDSEVVGHDETLLFIVVALYAVSVLTMSLTLMAGGVVCRPLSVGLGAFALGSGGVSPGGLFEYGMDFINRVCETQIKLETSQFWPVFTMVSFILMFAGAGLNAKFIAVYNRLHAIARKHYHSPLIGKETVRASEREPGTFETFYFRFMVAKVFAILVSVAMLGTFWYTVLSFAHIRTTGEAPNVTFSGGNLLIRDGAVCDARSLRFEEPFDEQYRCHLKGEAQMHYLKFLVLFSVGLVIIVSVYQTWTMRANFRSYRKWKRNREDLDARAKEQTVPGTLTPEMTSMFKMTRGLVRLIMYYMKPSPPDGDLPGLIAKAVFGLSPEPEEMALISSKMLTEFASPTETSEMLMSFMKGVLGEHIGESDDVRKIVLATVTAWKDSSTQRYLKGIVDTINAIHKDERDGGDTHRRSPASAPAPHTPTPRGHPGAPRRRPEPRPDALMHSESIRQRMNQ